MRYEREYGPNPNIENRLSKSIRYKKITGVCSGIAKYYDLPRILVRVAAIAALILLPVATGVAYVVASILLPEN